MSLQEEIGRIATAAPDRTAVRFAGRALSYGELHRVTGELAGRLTGAGVRPGDVVAVRGDRIDYVTGMLAVWRAGGVYLPLDPAAPAERTDGILADAGARVVLEGGALEPRDGRLACSTSGTRKPAERTDGILAAADADRTSGTPKPTERTDGIAAGARLVPEGGVLDAPSAPNPESRTDADARLVLAGGAPVALPEPCDDRLAYLIYTSGTTGTPKGVAVGHRPLASHLAAITARFGIAEGDVVLHLAGPAVDVAVEQVLTALTTGARLVLPERRLLSADELLALIEAERVTVANLPAGYFHDVVAAMNRVPTSLRVMISGSDRLSPAVAAEWTRRTGVRLLNAYGPTETVITATVHETAGETGSVPIGTEVGERRAYLLDGLSPAESGELYVGGAELAAGYLGRPGLTATRFLPDPFGPPGARMYRTGDMVRRSGNGDLEFVGRTDGQVKIRGYRVELGEVEHALAAHPAVDTCVVVPHGTGLAAYVTAANPPDQLEIREFLARSLPEHMVPATVTMLDALPLTAGGKVDRSALPEPAAPQTSTVDDMPRTQAEQLIAGIWADVLGVPAVGLGDTFFDLGGDSLTAVRVAGRVFEVFGPVSPYLIFDAPVLGDFTAALRDQLADTPADRPGPVREPAATAPLSVFQRGLWLAECWRPGTATYNVPWLFRFTGGIDAGLLQRALNAVVARHEALRTTVETGEDMVPRQVIHDHVEIPFGVLSEGTLDEQIRAVAQEPFDLATGPLLRARLIEGSDTTLVLVMHHIVWDEGSLRVLDRELREYYTAFAEGREPRLPELAVQYGDYTRWLAAQPTGESTLDFWVEHLRGAPTTPAIRPDHQPAERTRIGGHHRFAFDADLADGVRQLARAAGATPYMVLLAALVEVHRRRGAGDVVIGTPVSVRDRAELDALIGYFINLIPLRFRPDPEELTGRDLLDHVRGVALDGFRHQDVPFDDVVAATGAEGNPLFQLVFEMHTADVGVAPLGEVAVSRRLHVNELSRFDLSWSVEDDGTGFHGRVEFDTDLFTPDTLAALSAEWQAAVAELVADPDALLPVSQTETVDIDTPVHVRFAEQAHRTPNATAVISGDQRLTYAELDAAANRVAHHLCGLGVVPGDVVAIRIPRETGLVVALLATLKAGAAYTLLDPELPRARLDRAVADTNARLVVTADIAAAAAGSGDDPGVRVDADAVACVMFTSGSTGRPKGVAATHRALAGTYSGQTYAGFGADEVWLQCSPVSWDAFGLELYGALLFGGACVLHPGQRPDPQTMADLVARHGVTQLQLSASLFNFLVDELPEVFARLRVVFTGGERASVTHVARLAERYPGVRVVNGYGPVESMGFTTTHDVAAADLAAPAIPIGRAITHKGVHVLDEKLQPVSGTDSGDIYVTGAGLALGYVAQSGATAGRFLPDPFGPPGARMYRTGDIGSWNPDGTLAITGRADDQVKIRGFRVEPGEVAAALAGCPGVNDCAVVAHEPVAGQPRLAAYLTSGDATPPDHARVHDYLATLLPDYMIPASVTVLDALPLTPNGKLDRAALPAPTGPATEAPTTEQPGTDTERLVAGVWAEVLGVAAVGPHDNFFRLGGNSLAAVQVAMRLSRATGDRIPPRLVFATRTVSAMARKLDTTGATK